MVFSPKNSVTATIPIVILIISGCAFNFKLTSQRTALENQVIGTYNELEDDLMLVATMRAGDGQQIMTLRERASFATQNRKFNQDDIDEFKQKGILGEALDGTLVVLPKNVVADEETVAKNRKIIEMLMREENRDRDVQWRYTIETNENLAAADLGNVRATFAKLQRDDANSGDWIQNEEKQWIQKTEAAKVKTEVED